MASDDPRLSEQQARPLSVLGASVALSAGAGCGKTTVLTARFLGDLDGPDARPLGSIVALTFTEKAARELRKRIRARCRAQLDAGRDPQRWRALLRGLEAAPIGTFHEFCGQWLRRHAVEAGVDPDFVVLDESIAGSIRDEALARCLRRRLAERDPDLVELAVEFGLSRVREALGDLLAARSLGRLDDWAGRTPEELVATWREVWDRRGRAGLLARLARSCGECLDLLSPNESTHPKMRERRAFLLEHLPGLARDGGPEDWLRAIKEQAKVQGAGTKANWPSPDVHEAVQAAFKRLRDAIEEFLKKSRWDETATNEAAEHGLRLARLALRARDEYDAAKRARGGLDFDDLLVLALDLVRRQAEAGAPAAGAGGTIDRLLVDEFQDTDPIQGEILERLAGAEAGAGRLFLVGDTKQSIYRFRGARPRIFADFRDTFPEHGRHALTENFRSVPGILDFVNALFAEAFPDPETALVARVEAPGREDQPAVEFLWATHPEEPAAAKPSAHERRALEAAWLARRLRRRLDAGWTVRDRATGQPRAAAQGDIALLFRAMTDVGPYESALRDEGFEYHTVGGAAFYLQQEVHDLINLLSTIEDPLDPVALAGALRSPFFCLSDDGLFWLATARGDLVEGVLEADRIAELSERDRRQARRARELLERWRAIKDRVPIATLVDRVLDESGYEAALLGEPLGPRKRANARKLVRLARRFDREGGFTLSAFVARLRADLRRPPREEQAATTDEDGRSVRLMSIHQAKGLEFPIVVLPDLNRRPPGRTETVAFHPELGPLVRPSRDPSGDGPADGEGAEGDRQSLGWLAYQVLEQREDEEEALRLFYVAATRARDALILSAALGPDEKASSPALALLDGRFDRQTGTCRAALPDGWRVPSVCVTRQCPDAGPAPPRRRAAALPLIETAETIEQAIEEPEPAPATPAHPPRFVDLDPARGLEPGPARRLRLARVVLSDPELFRSKDWPAHAARALRRYDGLLSPRRIEEVIEHLRPWIEGPVGRALSGAEQIGCALDWAIAWPPAGPEATVFHGRTDLAYRDRDGTAGIVLVGEAGTSEPREGLRLLLAARAAAAEDFGPVRRGWRVRLGPGRGIAGEERFDDRAIDEAIRSLAGSGPSR